MKTAAILCAVLGCVLAGCGGGADWTKAGSDEATAVREYQDCRDLAGTAVRTDEDIDQDILATRQNDWQRGGFVRLGTQTMHEQTRDRAAAIVARCMAAKGFTRAP